MALGCGGPKDWGMDVTRAEGRGGRNSKSELGSWEKLMATEVISIPLVPTASPQHSSHPDCLSPTHPKSPLERKEGTWVSLVPYLWRQPAGF